MNIKKIIRRHINVLILITSVLAFFISAEVLLRIWDPLERKKGLADYTLKRGNMGTRRRLPLGPKDKDEFRILALGDSYTWGAGIDETSKVWPDVLERKLRE